MATTFAPDTWHDPFEPYSVMTCFVQWGIGGVGCVVFARWYTKHLRA